MKESYIEGKLFNAGVLEKDQLLQPATSTTSSQIEAIASLELLSSVESEGNAGSDRGSESGRSDESGRTENLDTVDVVLSGIGMDVPARTDFSA